MASSEYERGEQELGGGHMGEVKTKRYSFTDEHSSQQMLQFHSDVMGVKTFGKYKIPLTARTTPKPTLIPRVGI